MTKDYFELIVFGLFVFITGMLCGIVQTNLITANTQSVSYISPIPKDMIVTPTSIPTIIATPTAQVTLKSTRSAILK